MTDVATLFLAACATALATGLGAIPVFLLGDRARDAAPALLGFSAGVMAVAAVVGLLLPALEDAPAWTVLVGLGIGIGFLALVRARIQAEPVLPGSGDAATRTTALVFLVLFVHSLPEGLAIGTAYASDRAGLSFFVIVAIAIQNIPEGTSVAIPMQEAGASRIRQFWTAVATSAPQPVGALVAYFAVEQVTGLLPLSFAFAAGAMLALIVAELLPKAYGDGRRWGPTGAVVLGAAVMLGFSFVLGL